MGLQDTSLLPWAICFTYAYDVHTYDILWVKSFHVMRYPRNERTMRFVVLLNGVHRYKFSNVLSKGGTTWGEIKRALFTELTHELKFLGPTKPTINDLIWQGHKDDSRVTYARGKDAHCPLNLLVREYMNAPC